MSTEARFHSLDAVRAFALLTGIVLHSTMAYLPGYREHNMPIADSSSSLIVAVLFYVIHIFRMSVFYFISGFFARALFHRLGLRQFIGNRLRRIALPLVVFWIVATPLTVAALIWGATQLHVKGPPTYPPPSPQRGVFLGPLWFLYILLLLYSALLVVRECVVRFVDQDGRLRSSIDRALLRTIASRFAPVLLAVPLCASLYRTKWWSMWQGIPSPMLGFVPNGPALIGYGTAFLFGWFVHRQLKLLQFLRRDWLVYAVAAVGLTVISLWLVGPFPQFGIVNMSPVNRLTYAAGYTVSIWCWAFAIVGAAVRYLSAPSARWRYVADASYWMYLMHFPLVLALQAWMIKWPLQWSIKFPLVVGIALTILLVSYRYMVRYTFIGTFLNGRKIRDAIVRHVTAAA